MSVQKRSLLAFGVATALLGAACSDLTPTADRAESKEDLAAAVEALGFRGDMIEDHGSFLLVEGDIYLPKSQLRAARPSSSGDPLQPRFQYTTNNLVGSPKVQQIVVDVSGLSSQTGWQSAARDAIAYWSGISGSYVKMVEGSPADITVSTTCTSYNVAAYASFPSGGNPGSTIYVNTCFGYSTTNAQKVHNMVHEFGHTIGFRHSNYAQLGESAGTEGANHVYGTPTSGNASGSVMNGGTALNSWAGFTTSDVNATKWRYSLPAPTVSASNPTGTVWLSWPAVIGALYYQVRRYEVVRESNGYENWSNEYIYDGSWVNVYATSFDTGATWTGVSSCFWWYGYTESSDDSYYEVRGVFANGTGYHGFVGANDMTNC